MFTVTNIVEKLNFFDVNCDITNVENLIKTLNINPIDTNDKGEQLYSEEAYEQIKNNLIFEQYKIETQNDEVVDNTNTQITTKEKNVELLATTLSNKITDDLKEYIKNNLYTEEAIQSGIYKHDNELLSKKLKEIITENKKLVERINELEKEHRKYHLIFSNIYIKEK